MTDQSTTERTHTCDCGFTWKHGLSGSHICGPYYRERIAELERENAELANALKLMIELPNYAAAPSHISKDEFERRIRLARVALASHQKEDKA